MAYGRGLHLLDFRKVKEVHTFSQSVNKLGRLFVALLCECPADVVVYLSHHVAKVTRVGVHSQHFTQLGDVPRSVPATSIRCVPERRCVAKEEIGLLGYGVRERWWFRPT